MDLLSTVARAHRGLGFNSLKDHAPEVVVGLRALRNPVWFVDSNAASGGNGRSWDSAVLTVNAAIALANAGDIILVAPGHAETLSAAAGISVTKAGLSIIGIGHGSKRPTFTMGTATTVDVDIDAADCLMENLLFVANFADIAAAIDVNADDFTIRNCEFRESTDLNFKICIQDAAAGGSDRISVIGCHARCPDAANTHFINFAGTGDGHRVIGNWLFGDWGTMAIGGAGIVTNVIVADNVIRNAATDNDSCINFAATATGVCVRNLAHGGAAQANGFTGQNLSMNQNFYGVVNEDLSGILDPIAT